MTKHYFVTWSGQAPKGLKMGHTMMTFQNISLAQICETIKSTNGLIDTPVITFLRGLDEDEFNMLKGE